MRATLHLALLAMLAIPAVALAHGTGVHARGTIKEVMPDRVVLTGKGPDQAFAVDASTRILRGDGSVRIEDVRVGERAVVHARRDGERLRATEIRLAPAGKAKNAERRKG